MCLQEEKMSGLHCNKKKTNQTQWEPITTNCSPGKMNQLIPNNSSDWRTPRFYQTLSLRCEMFWFRPLCLHSKDTSYNYSILIQLVFGLWGDKMNNEFFDTHTASSLWLPDTCKIIKTASFFSPPFFLLLQFSTGARGEEKVGVEGFAFLCFAEMTVMIKSNEKGRIYSHPVWGDKARGVTDWQHIPGREHSPPDG